MNRTSIFILGLGAALAFPMTASASIAAQCRAALSSHVSRASKSFVTTRLSGVPGTEDAGSSQHRNRKKPRQDSAPPDCRSIPR